MTDELQLAALSGLDAAARKAAQSISVLNASVREFAQKITDILFWEYVITEGAPYGKTYKGFTRWLKTRDREPQET